MAKLKLNENLKSAIIIMFLMAILALFFVISILNSTQVTVVGMKTAQALPTSDADCNDTVPMTQHDFQNTASGLKVHWTGCVVYVRGKYGEGFFDPMPDKKGYYISRVLIPITDVTTAQQTVIWKKEVPGNAYALLYQPDIKNDEHDRLIVVDGLAALFLSPEDQQTMQLEYPKMNKIFEGKYVQWGLIENTTTTYTDCKIALAIHYSSLQGSILPGGIAPLFEPGQIFSACKSSLLNPK